MFLILGLLIVFCFPLWWIYKLLIKLLIVPLEKEIEAISKQIETLNSNM